MLSGATLVSPPLLTTVVPSSLADQCVDKAKVDESEEKAAEFSKKVNHPPLLVGPSRPRSGGSLSLGFIYPPSLAPYLTHEPSRRAIDSAGLIDAWLWRYMIPFSSTRINADILM